MFIELVDHLRCIRPHEDSWLVLSADRFDGRDVVEGMLGCPVCRAEYPIRAGVVQFVGPGRTTATAAAEAVAPPSPDAVVRLAALLGLAEPGGLVLLGGRWAALARPLRALVDVQVVVLDGGDAVTAGDGVSPLVAPAGAVPLAAGSLRAAALDASAAGAGLRAAVTALRGRGRLLAPTDSPVPTDVVELARDAEVWVAEREGVTSAPVRLGRVRR